MGTACYHSSWQLGSAHGGILDSQPYCVFLRCLKLADLANSGEQRNTQLTQATIIIINQSSSSMVTTIDDGASILIWTLD
jgi:hypothetical protein